MLELLTYYVVVSVLFVGAPGVFFLIVFMPALQNTKGRIVGYRERQVYGESTINPPLRSKKWLQNLEPEERVLE
jgi:hypothetical protein